MPELPEVETIRRQLAKKIIGKKIGGKKIIDVRRRAKILMIDFADGFSLVFHLKLTGQLIYNGKPSKYTRKVFYFDDGSVLIFNDLRKFGWWKKVKNTKGIERQLGPEPLGLGLKQFKAMLKKRKKAKIKPLLMDQKFIAGLGNIYSDEILFTSFVKPTRLAGSLKDKEQEAILANVKKILRKAIKARGSSVKHYLDVSGRKGDYVKYHRVYQKAGQKCSRCGVIIRRIKLGGRSAHFCPKCQI